MSAVQKRTSKEHIAGLIRDSGEGAARQWDADYLAALGISKPEDIRALTVSTFDTMRAASFVVNLDGTVSGDPEAVLNIAYGLAPTMPNLGTTVAVARLALMQKQAQERAAAPPPAPPSAKVAGWRRVLCIHDSFVAMAILCAMSIAGMLGTAHWYPLIGLAAMPVGAFATARMIQLGERKSP